MKAHLTIMSILVVFAAIILFFSPTWGIDRSIGLFLLICPLMMLGMMLMMRDNHKHK